jgi:hypothetical protein
MRAPHEVTKRSDRNKYKGHTHDWQRTERIWNGQTFKLFVCLDHEKPLVNAYDLEVMKSQGSK